MMKNFEPEVWLRGPVEGISAYLMPAAHALLQAKEDVKRLAADIEESGLWERANGAASIGFHLLHISGSLDRLASYARGQSLSNEQRQTLALEKANGDPSLSIKTLVEKLEATIESTLQQLRETPNETILEERRVGAAGLPSNVLGLLFHAAEHTQRHVGQMIATLKILDKGD